MSVDKLVDSTQLDSDLTEVADEIRTAGGTLLPLSFPDDYVVAIGDIGNTEIKTASGSIAHFEDALARKAQDLTVAIEPVQDLHGYDNPWPAGGGKNLLRMPYSDGTSKTENGIIYSVESNGSLRASGTSISQTNFYFYGNNGVYEDIKLPSGTYVFSISVDGMLNGLQWFCVKSDGELVIGETISTAQRYKVIEIDSSVTYRIFVRVLNMSTINATIKLQIESGSTVTPWTPYSNICPISGWTGANIHVSPTTDAADGTTYSITFPASAGTVYGGTLDVTTGKLTVDMAKRILNGSEIWAGTPNSGWYTYDGNLKKLTSYVGHMMADTLPAGEPRENWLYGYSDLNNRYPNQNWIYYKNSNLDSAESAKAFFVANPTNVVYRLATPIVYDLDPVTVTTLLGTNNVWADTGDSTIQYIAPKAQIPSAQGVYF